MDEARKKVRVCLLCVVAAAVIIGLVYYFRDVRNADHITDGTLVRQTEAFLKTAADGKSEQDILLQGGNAAPKDERCMEGSWD